MVHRWTTSKYGLTRLTTARTWGKPLPSPLEYTLCLAIGTTPKCHFVSRLLGGSPEITKVGTPTTLEPITLCEDLWLKWCLKQSCSPHRKLFNDMWHATCIGATFSSWEWNRKPWIGPSFDHNLCFNYPNRSCKPILNIYVPRTFQWYKKLFNLMGFWPLQSLTEYLKVHRDSKS